LRVSIMVVRVRGLLCQAVINMIKCAACKYKVVVNDFTHITGDPENWKPVKCNCPDSDYYGAWLNITLDGNPQSRVTWTGCPFGERSDET
jgi:hypothetical protein